MTSKLRSALEWFGGLFLCKHKWLVDDVTYVEGLLAERVICIRCGTVHTMELKVFPRPTAQERAGETHPT